MKINLEGLLKAFSLPVGLVAVFSAVLGLFGVELDTVTQIGGAMLGGQALIGLLVDVLKWAGVVGDGKAGVWSAGLNLLGVVAIAVGLGINPGYDFPGLDAQVAIIVNFGTLVFGYIVQVVGTKYVHRGYVDGLGVRAFSYGVG